MSMIVGPDGAPVRQEPPVTERVICGACGVTLPRPPPHAAGGIEACPGCRTPLRIAHWGEIWCVPVSKVELGALEAAAFTAGGGRFV